MLDVSACCYTPYSLDDDIATSGVVLKMMGR
jgi:hypothetical protein